VSVVDADLSSITMAADKVVVVHDPNPWILHVEFQANYDATLPTRLLSYNGLLQHRHQMPVATIAILLASRANASNLTGEWSVEPVFGPSWRFCYELLRVWEQPPRRFLDGPTALVPLALIADVPREQLRETVGELFSRLQQVPDRSTADQLLATAFMLSNLRYDDMTIQEMMSDVEKMKEIPAFRIMYDEGREEEARSLLIRLGRRRLGNPSPSIQSQIAAMTDVKALEDLMEQLMTATSWKELFPAT
jgi:hypothetical protein